jgi:hypothetical protein
MLARPGLRIIKGCGGATRTRWFSKITPCRPGTGDHRAYVIVASLPVAAPAEL